MRCSFIFSFRCLVLAENEARLAIGKAVDEYGLITLWRSTLESEKATSKSFMASRMKKIRLTKYLRTFGINRYWRGGSYYVIKNGYEKNQLSLPKKKALLHFLSLVRKHCWSVVEAAQNTRAKCSAARGLKFTINYQSKLKIAFSSLDKWRKMLKNHS